MLKEKKHFIFIIAVFCLGFLSLGMVKLSIYGQIMLSSSTPKTSEPQNIELEQSPNLINRIASAAPAVSPNAIAENIRLKNSLGWTFGGKSQRGWYLYVSLIQQTIGTETAADSPEFARAVAVWQQRNGLVPTGTIDEETLYEMIKFWQARRLNSSEYPTDDKLLTAPIFDFYDPTRSIELLKIERETYAAYKKMLRAAAKDLNLRLMPMGELAPDENFLRIVSAFRSREYQTKLRRAEPGSGRAGLAVNSPHFTGHAIDIYVGGEPVTTKDFNRAIQVQTPAYKWLVKNAAKFGFYPYFYEPWHWEYVPRNLNSSFLDYENK
ncbi:MAG: D-alanyl-D-alanine carboxypeptidase family protein [Pyrinomonadaceae bacterium]